MSRPPDGPALDQTPLTTVVTLVDAETARVAVAGDLDRRSGTTLTRAVERLVGDGALTSIVLDLTDLQFLDAAGARALGEARATCAAVNCDLQLANPRPLVRCVLGIVGLVDPPARPPEPPPLRTTAHTGRSLDAKLAADRSAMKTAQSNAAALQETTRTVLARTADIQRANEALRARITARRKAAPPADR